MSWWARLRRGSSQGEHAAADWVAAGSPLPDEEPRIEALAFELGQVLAIQGRRGAKPWAQRRELVERVVTGPRWAEAGYRFCASADACRVTDAGGDVVVLVAHDPDTDGHVIERYDAAALVERTRFGARGRVER